MYTYPNQARHFNINIKNKIVSTEEYEVYRINSRLYSVTTIRIFFTSMVRTAKYTWIICSERYILLGIHALVIQHIDWTLLVVTQSLNIVFYHLCMIHVNCHTPSKVVITANVKKRVAPIR